MAIELTIPLRNQLDSAFYAEILTKTMKEDAPEDPFKFVPPKKKILPDFTYDAINSEVEKLIASALGTSDQTNTPTEPTEKKSKGKGRKKSLEKGPTANEKPVAATTTKQEVRLTRYLGRNIFFIHNHKLGTAWSGFSDHFS